MLLVIYLDIIFSVKTYLHCSKHLAFFIVKICGDFPSQDFISKFQVSRFKVHYQILVFF